MSSGKGTPLWVHGCPFILGMKNGGYLKCDVLFQVK